MATCFAAIFRVMPLMTATAALLPVFVQSPGWRAALITAIVFLGPLMVIDSNANARLETYRVSVVRVFRNAEAVL